MTNAYICCMCRLTIISTLICVLEEYVVCCMFIYNAHDNCHFYEVACPGLGGLDVYDVSVRIFLWHSPTVYG